MSVTVIIVGGSRLPAASVRSVQARKRWGGSLWQRHIVQRIFKNLQDEEAVEMEQCFCSDKDAWKRAAKSVLGRFLRWYRVLLFWGASWDGAMSTCSGVLPEMCTVFTCQVLSFFFLLKESPSGILSSPKGDTFSCFQKYNHWFLPGRALFSSVQLSSLLKFAVRPRQVHLQRQHSCSPPCSQKAAWN